MTASTQKAFAKFKRGYDRSCLWEAYRRAGSRVYALVYGSEQDTMAVEPYRTKNINTHNDIKE